MKKINLIIMIISFWVCISSPASAVSLTSITLDPEDASGSTTNAPGAWSTNTADPLSQVGVKNADGVFLNQGADTGVLGEINIPLEPGINSFALVGNVVSPQNLYYGCVLFFDGVATPPSIAVYNENAKLGNFMIQDAGTTIMGGANGGLFFDVAPGTAVYVAPDGSTVEVLSFVINSIESSTVDEISYGEIGPDGTPDTTAHLILMVTPPKSVSGCVQLFDNPVAGSKVFLKQAYEPRLMTYTDTDGCYRFGDIVSGKDFAVIIRGPIVPEN